MKTSYTLEHPVIGRHAQTGDPVMLLDHLELRRPTAKDDAELDDFDGPFLESARISRLSGQPEALIDRMDAFDLEAVDTLIGRWRGERSTTIKPGDSFRFRAPIKIEGGEAVESIVPRRVTGADKKAIAKLTPNRGVLTLVIRLSGLSRKHAEQIDCADFEALARSLAINFFPRRSTMETSPEPTPTIETPSAPES